MDKAKLTTQSVSPKAADYMSPSSDALVIESDYILWT